ncbi:hypothetical protein B0H11DRAFT_2220172 [Mycena galericulata]|nr:hypothetical protein B0H11DRAFT_2220172 [Mycena galericulata]
MPRESERKLGIVRPAHARRCDCNSSWPTQIPPPLPSIATRASAPPVTRVCAWRPDSRAHAGSLDIPVLPLPLENASKSQSTPRDVLNPALAPDPLPCGWLRRSVRCSMRSVSQTCTLGPFETGRSCTSMSATFSPSHPAPPPLTLPPSRATP